MGEHQFLCCVGSPAEVSNFLCAGVILLAGILIVFLFLVKLFFLSLVEIGLLFLFLKGVGDSIPINTLYREVIYVMCVFE